MYGEAVLLLLAIMIANGEVSKIKGKQSMVNQSTLDWEDFLILTPYSQWQTWHAHQYITHELDTYL